MAGLLGKLHAFVDRGMRGDAIHVKQLKCAEPQCDEHLGIEASVGPLEQRRNSASRPNLPAQRAEHERRCQVAVGGGERVHGPSAQQFVGVRMSALDGEQDLESSFARGEMAATAFNPAACAAARRRTAQKFCRPETLLAFQLQLDQFEPCVLARRQRKADRYPCGSGRARFLRCVEGRDSSLCTMSFFPSSVVNAPGQG